MAKHFCPYCMTPVPEGESCPACGLTSGNYVPSPHHLPPGTVLLDRYLVGRVLGEGGFGITYIGCDLRLELKVAIKEYYPVDRATRNASASLEVTSFIGPQAKSFERGKEKFLNEARTMAKMDKQQAIVGVRDFFELNNTAYIVMEYVEGTTFAELREQRGGRIPPEELFRVIEPLFGALSALHENGLIHRDISPDNLMLESGEVRLLDFGCAREASRGTETVTIALKHGYAPLEQYQQRGQGPWTDVYALCATIYYCLTGQAPPQALDRIAGDELIPPGKLGVAIAPQQEKALLRGLATKPTRRYQTMKELWAALYAPEPPVPTDEEEPEEPADTEGRFPKTDMGASEAETPSAPEPEPEAPVKTVAEAPPARTEQTARTSAADTASAASEEPSGDAARRRGLSAKAKRYGAIGAAALLLVLLLIALLPKGGEKAPGPVEPGAEQDGENRSDGIGEAPAVSPDDAARDALFENAAVMTEWDPERFHELLADASVPAIVVDVGDWIDLGGMTEEGILPVTTVAKPVRLGGDEWRGMVFHANRPLTVTESGYLDIRNAFFEFTYLRLEGSGERVHKPVNADLWGWVRASDREVVWADERANLGNLFEGFGAQELPHILTVSEGSLFADAVTVTSWDELVRAQESGRAVVLGADISMPAQSDWVHFAQPILIPEGRTLEAAVGDPPGLRRGSFYLSSGATVVNHGTLNGWLQCEGGVNVLSDGTLGESAEQGFTMWTQDNGACNLISLGSLNDPYETHQYEGALVNLGDMTVSRHWLHGTQVWNFGKLNVTRSPNNQGLMLRRGAVLHNCASLNVGRGALLDNATYIEDTGAMFVERGATVKNGALSYNYLTAAAGANFEEAGAAVYGGGMFSAPTASQTPYQVYYGWFDNGRDIVEIAPSTGSVAAVATEEELRKALKDDLVKAIRIDGRIEGTAALRLTKPTRIASGAGLYMRQGLNTVSGYAKLTVEGAELCVDDGGRLDTAFLTLLDAALTWGGGLADIRIREGGELSAERSFLGSGWGMPAIGGGVTVKLSDGSVLVTHAGNVLEGGSLSDFSLTVESGSSVIFTGVQSDTQLELSGVGLTLDGGTLKLGGDLTLNDCAVSVQNGGLLFCAGTTTVFSGCEIAIDARSEFFADTTNVFMARGTTFTNDGTTTVGKWEEYGLTLSRDSTIVNNGTMVYLCHSASDIAGTVENRGKLIFGDSNTPIESLNVVGNPPVRG